MRRLAALLGSLLAGAASVAMADVVLEDVHAGYWNSSGAYCLNLPFAGSGDAGGECRAFLMFDLSEVEPGRITSAVLSLEIEGFWSTAQTECFAAFDVGDSATDDLLDGIHSTAIWADLGNGKSYSDEVCLTHSDRGSLVEVPLSQEAIDDLNAAASGFFPVGITSTTVDGTKDGTLTEGVRFGFGNPSQWTNELILTLAPVPVPVAVDIKPRSESNPVMPLSRGVIPVAILGSDTFVIDGTAYLWDDAPRPVAAMLRLIAEYNS